MLSYKEYKLLNESLYGAFNLGLRSHTTVGGIVSGSSINGTEAALEAESEEALEEAKKGKKMKKKMGSGHPVVISRADKDDDEDEDHDDEDHDDEDHDDEDHDDEDHDDEDHDDEDHDDEDEEDEDEEDDGAADIVGRDTASGSVYMKKKMKKKSKKEWSEVMSDLEDLLEVVEDEDALTEVKKGLEMMKKGMKKGMEGGCNKDGNYMKKGMEGGCKKCGKNMSEGKKHRMKNHKPDCACPMCSGESKFGKAMSKKMNEADQAWWDSVNGMLGANTDQKNWDGGWSEVGEVQQGVREGEEINEMWPFKAKDQEDSESKVERIALAMMSGDDREYRSLEPQFKRAVDATIENKNGSANDQSLQNRYASSMGRDATRKAQAQETERQAMMRSSDLRDRRKYGSGGAGGAQRARDNAPQRYGREDTPAGEDHGY